MRVSQDKNVDFTLTPSFISTFTTASDQASKLGLNKNKTIISMYSNYQVSWIRDLYECVFGIKSAILLFLTNPSAVKDKKNFKSST